MTELRLHGRPAGTVFDLLGEKEDDITSPSDSDEEVALQETQAVNPDRRVGGARAQVLSA